jgi:hypothetical protein
LGLGKECHCYARDGAADKSKCNTVYRYERWGCTPKLKLKGINMSNYTAN